MFFDFLSQKNFDLPPITRFTFDHGDLFGEEAFACNIHVINVSEIHMICFISQNIQVNTVNSTKVSPTVLLSGYHFLRYPTKVRKAKIIQTATSNVEFVPTILSLMSKVFL